MPANRRKKSDIRVISDGGEVFVQSPSITAYYRYPKWLFKINQHVLLPGLRRNHRKIIFVNGKKYGTAEYREGCIPLTEYLGEEVWWSDKITRFVKVHFGLGCRKNHRGYFKVKLGHYEYIVLRRYTKENNIFCHIYYKPTEELMGTFIIDSTFTKVYPQFAVDHWVNSMYVIIGYITDAVLYSTVAMQLNKTIDVIIN